MDIVVEEGTQRVRTAENACLVARGEASLGGGGREGESSASMGNYCDFKPCLLPPTLPPSLPPSLLPPSLTLFALSIISLTAV